MTHIFNEKTKITNSSDASIPIDVTDSTVWALTADISGTLRGILKELKRINLHLTLITDAEISGKDIP